MLYIKDGEETCTNRELCTQDTRYQRFSYMSVHFDLGEDIRTQARKEQDEKWGNAEIDARTNLSNRYR